MRRAIRTRIAFLNLLITASALTLFATLLYFWVARTLYQHHDGDLADDARRVVETMDGSGEPLDALAELDKTAASRGLLLVRDANGQMLFRSSRLAEIEPDIGAHTVLMHAATGGATTTQFFSVRLARGPARFICIPVSKPAGAYLQYGRLLGDVDYLLDALIVASAVLVPLVIVVTSFGGLIIAKRALAPIEAIAAALESIQATRLARRVDPHATDAEVTRLTLSINRLLDRLQASFSTMKEFTADVSHQLLTPLTVMKGTIDVALSGTREVHDHAPLLRDLSHEVDALTATLEDLRDLAMADADSVGPGRERVDVSAVFAEAADVLQALAESHDLRCEIGIAPDLMVWGNAVRLRQVVLNLGENAVQHTPAGGRIVLDAVTNHSDEVVLSVQDTGTGIAPEVLPLVFERRFHINPAGETRGLGLGLAIVKRIVEAHGGRITIQSAVGTGTTVVVTLPSAQSEIAPVTARLAEGRPDPGGGVIPHATQGH